MAEVLKSIKSSGGDYATVALFEAAIPSDQPVGDPWIGKIEEAFDANGGSDLTVNVSNVNGAPHEIQVADGYRFYDAAGWATSVEAARTQCGRLVRTTTSGGHQIVNQSTPDFVWRYVLFDAYKGGLSSTGANTRVISCVATNHSGVFDAFGFRMSGSGSVLVNCVAVGDGTSANRPYDNRGTVDYYHCTAINGQRNFDRPVVSTGNCYGCISVGASSGDFDSNLGGDENVSSDTTAPGTTTWKSQTGVLVSTTSGAEDPHLASGKDGSYEVTDRSGTVAELATDIDGDTRSDWDAGCDEYVVAGAASDFPFHIYYAGGLV